MGRNHKNAESNSSKHLVVLRELFARYGLPDTFVSDNGGQFCALDMGEYLKLHGIKHMLIAPGHPASNGQAENAVGSFKSALKAMVDEHDRNKKVVDIDLMLQRYLIDYRSTKHCTTNETPAKLMLGREVKTKLNLLKPPTQKETVERAQMAQVNNFKGKRSIRYMIGQKVVVKNYADPNNSKWVDAEITRIIGPRSYLVKLGTGRTIKRHINQIRDNVITETNQTNVHKPVSVLKKHQRYDSYKSGNGECMNPYAVSVIKRDLSSENNVADDESDPEASNIEIIANEGSIVNNNESIVLSDSNDKLVPVEANTDRSGRIIQKPIRYRH